MLFLAGITGIFFISGFSSTISSIRKNSPKTFGNHLMKKESQDGRGLAIRALGWGSLYSFLGCSIFFYGIWKISGAKSFEDFRQKTQNFLPKISKTKSL